MSDYYNAKRKSNLFSSQSESSFRLSRSKIDLFLECPRCFYLDRKLGIGRPPGYPFTLNSAVDTLLKKEFDIYREKQAPHPLMIENNIDAVPFKHKEIDIWRNNWKGVQYLHEPTNLLITGAIDDVWINSQNQLIVVDYKATAKKKEVTLDADWQIAYKRQVEIYQWLLRRNGFKVSDISYFVYCNGNTRAKAFNNKIEFRIKVIPYKGDDGWIEETIKNMHHCLSQNIVPEMGQDCDYCAYKKASSKVEGWK